MCNLIVGQYDIVYYSSILLHIRKNQCGQYLHVFRWKANLVRKGRRHVLRGRAAARPVVVLVVMVRFQPKSAAPIPHT